MANPVQLHAHPETMAVVQLPFSVAAPAANSVLFLELAVPGVQVGDLVWLFKPTVTADVAFGSAIVTAPHQVTVTVISLETPGTPGTETYTVFWIRGARLVPSFEDA